MKQLRTRIIVIGLIAYIVYQSRVIAQMGKKQEEIVQDNIITCQNFSTAVCKNTAYNDILAVMEMRKNYCIQQSRIMYYESEEDRFFQFADCTVKR